MFTSCEFSDIMIPERLSNSRRVRVDHSEINTCTHFNTAWVFSWNW